MKERTGLFVAAGIIAWTAIVSAHGAARADDDREVEGRTLFAKGEYQAALDIYAGLFARKGDPIYLRNVGRCYQKLEKPQKAIDAFREYLRRAHVKPDERAEVEGFIAEMKELQKQQAAASAPPPEPVHPVAAPEPAPAPPPAVDDTAASTNGAPGTTLNAGSAPAEEPSTPITHRWWFWTGLAVLLAGGAATAFVLTRSHTSMPACTGVCP